MTPDMSNIVWLQDIGESDTPFVGSKAARLGELMRHGLPVPPGFCVTTATCRILSTSQSERAGSRT